ncbi:putative metal-nicotianamine transporter ysl12 [Asimina triloba]
MWPLIGNKKGDWYSADLRPDSLQGLQGYKIFVAISMILADGLYNFFRVMSITTSAFLKQLHDKQTSEIPELNELPPTNPSLSYDDQRRTELFMKDQIPTWRAFGGYIAMAAISIITLPHIFPQLKWHYVLVIYTFAPVLAFCNAYGCGLTDWSLASTYEKLAIFSIGAWARASPSHGGVLAGLAACGVMLCIVQTAADLMQDFKTGYLTLASPRSMFVSQEIGTAMGCVIAPCVFSLFYIAFDGIGTPGSEYPAPYALIYRNMAVLGIESFSILPKNCLSLCCVFFTGSILINLVRDILRRKAATKDDAVLPMAMAIPFYIGPYLAIDMCLGSFILFVWQKTNKEKADAFAPAVASGLICGDGLWTLPQSVLALAKLFFTATAIMRIAYGIAVVEVLLVTSCMLILILIMIWKQLLFIALFAVIFVSPKLAYFSSMMYKFQHGGFLSLAFSARMPVMVKKLPSGAEDILGGIKKSVVMAGLLAMEPWAMARIKHRSHHFMLWRGMFQIRSPKMTEKLQGTCAGRKLDQPFSNSMLALEILGYDA